MVRFSLLPACVLLAAGAQLASATAAGARGLSLGLFDAAAFEGSSGSEWYARARETGASFVRVSGSWATIAPAERTALARPRDPGDPAYRWQTLDAAVRGAKANGFSVLLVLNGAPAWAEGAGRPANAPSGSWRPDPDAYGDFLEAAARRYSGAFPDPLRAGSPLPRVRLWQIWNEPNLPRYLTPQWSRKGPFVRSRSPAWYRRLLNAAYPRVKAVHDDNTVIAAGTAPYGDPPSVENRMTPVRFMRELLCLRGAALRKQRCGARPRLDAIAHHPYATGTPTSRAFLEENVAIPDLYKLVRVLNAAKRKKTVGPAGPKGVWVTEVSWDSNPPDPDGVPERQRARWLQDTFYSLWRQGASAIAWFLIRDQAPQPSYAATYQSGLYLLDGTPKLSATAFRFPLVPLRSNGRTSVWGKSPARGSVVIERRSGENWRAIATLAVRRSGIFRGRVRAPEGAVLRGRAGAETSLSRRVR